MTKRTYALAYPKCTTTELRLFIKHRTRALPSTGRAKISYVRILRRLDREASFRFADLPAELRLLIYGNLLPKQWTPCGVMRRHLDILGTCRDIYQEAEPVLYRDIAFDINISSATLIGHLSSLWLSGNAVEDEEYGSAANFTLATCPVAFVGVLSRARHLNLSLTVHDTRTQPLPRSGLVKANHALYQVASKLMELPCLRGVSVKVHMGVVSRTVDTMKELLFPLALLASLRHRDVTVTFEGFSLEVEEHLCGYLPLSTREDALARCWQSFHEARHLLHDCVAAPEYVHDFQELIKNLEDVMGHLFSTEMVNMSRENRLVLSSPRLRHLLASPRVLAMKNESDAWRAKARSHSQAKTMESN